MVVGRPKTSLGPTSLAEMARLAGGFADWNNLILGAAWLTGELDIAALRDAWSLVCLRHDAMRRTYVSPDEACTHEDVLSEVEFYTAETDAAAIELMRQILGVPFSLNGPGFSHIVIVRRNDRRHLLGIVLDHIITDEVSWAQLMRDFAEFYRRRLDHGDCYTEDAGSYQSFASLERHEFNGRWGAERRRFWQSYTTEFGTFPPAFSLGAGSGKAPSLRVQPYELSPDIKSKVHGLARQARATYFTVIAAGVLTGMRAVTGERTTGIVTDDHGRTMPGTAATVGLFVRSAPLHLTGRARTPRETIQEVHNRSLDVFEYGLPLTIAGTLWCEYLHAEDRKPGMYVHLHDELDIPGLIPLAGTVAEDVQLSVPGGRDTSKSVLLDWNLSGDSPHLVATYDENRYPGAAIEEVIRVACSFVSSGAD